jgi:hypothetical protein
MGGFAGFMSGMSGKKQDYTTKKSDDKTGDKKKGPGGSNAAKGTSADEMGAETSGVPSYKKGGKVRKTGLARLHKGERVLNKRQAKQYKKSRGKWG